MNWAGGTVVKDWTDSWEPVPAMFGYYYTLMMVYDGRSDFQAKHPNAFTNGTSYAALLVWAAEVVEKVYPDSPYAMLAPYAATYEALG